MTRNVTSRMGMVMAVALAAAAVVTTEGCSSDGGADMPGDGGSDGNDGTGGGSDGTGASQSGSGGKGNGTGGTTIGGVGGSLLGQGGDGGDGQSGECNDGVDNDEDGYTDYAFDPGCYGPGDDEASGPRSAESGFTTFEFGDDSVVVYVSAEGDDGEDGSTPETAVQTLARADEIVRDGEHDFMLLRRGDTWRDESLGRFKSGRDAEHPIVVGSYGESLELPRIELAENFIDHDGQEKSYVALLDLHLVNYAKDPSDPEFDGATDSIVRYIGSGSNLLIEGCHFEYVELILQTLGDGTPYTDIQVRANVIEKAYHVDTCAAGDPNGNADFRPSGIYASHIDGLLIEGNVLDHNGWNEDVESACATIYNHNVYLNGNDIVIVDNVFSRASSIHIKLRSDTSGDMTGTRISGNYFVEGEIGVSIGGNTEEPNRFIDSEITSNVFSDIGRSQPTTRTLAWAVDVQDNDGALVSGNFILNQRTEGVNNSYGLNIAGVSNSDLTVSDNLLYRIQNRGLVADVGASHDAIVVSDNSFIDPDQGSRLVSQQGSFDAYTYSNNRYFSSASPGSWFQTEGGNVDLDGWTSASGETGAEGLSAAPDFADPDRTIESYASELQIGDSLEDYIVEARQQTRLRFYPQLSAPAINAYIKAGFAE